MRDRVARLDGDVDLVELAFLVEELLRGRQVEDRERGATERGVAELDDARDLELLLRAASRQEPDRARRSSRRASEAVFLSTATSCVADRPGAREERERIEALVATGVDAEGEPGRTVAIEHLAVPADELGLVADPTRRGRDGRTARGSWSASRPGTTARSASRRTPPCR